MLIPYNPCKDCKQAKEVCNKCAFQITKENYHRALERIVELSNELNIKVTILV